MRALRARRASCEPRDAAAPRARRCARCPRSRGRPRRHHRGRRCVDARPIAKHYEGWIASDFGDGVEVIRALAQQGVAPDVVRLSDQNETRVAAMSGAGGARRGASRPICGLRGRRRMRVAICGLGGRPRGGGAPPRLGRARAEGRGGRARPGARPRVGEGALPWPVPARRAARPRVLRRDARDRAHVVAARYALPRRRRSRCARRLGRGVVICHVSHLYPTARRCTSPGSPRRGIRARRSSPVAARRPRRGDRHGRGHDHPPSRGRARPRPLHGAPRSAAPASRPCARSRQRLDPSRDHEPGKLLWDSR